MRRVALATLLAASALVLGWLGGRQLSQAQSSARVLWIWHDEGEPGKPFPSGTRYFRRVFTINRPVQKPVDEAVLDITADDRFKVWVNGQLVGKGDDWKRVKAFDVQPLLVHGQNVIAVEAINDDAGSAGLLVRLGYVPNGMQKFALVSDGEWKSSATAKQGWQNVDFKDEGWKAVRVIGPYGQTEPWKKVLWDGVGNERFTVPAGFRVEQVVKVPDFDKTFSLVNLCFDDRGRLLVSRESGRGGGIDKGPIYLCTNPDKNGVLQTVKVYCDLVTNCQGMCWVDDALYLVGDGPDGTGLYRCRDTKKADRIDEVKLLHRFPTIDVPGYHKSGGMGEHGPHAIIHGPDGWLYLVVGNHAWVDVGKEAAKAGPNPEKLAANSPLTRWPTGRMGPDQGKPGTTEDVLLPRLNDGRGHAANIRAPGGTIWRLDKNGQNMSLFSAGYRNHYDAAFGPGGELFTFDSDMEWDEALPWYRPVRVCHATSGSDFVWRTGAANTPDYYIDSLPPTAETGRGSPVGVEFYDHETFGKKYRGAYFMADWAIGVIFAVHLKRDGASYKAEVEKFCTGAPMNVTDLVVGADGALYFTMGGRGSEGGVFRIVGSEPERMPALAWPQPLAAWSRKKNAKVLPTLEGMLPGLDAPEWLLTTRLQAMSGKLIPLKTVAPFLKDKDAEVRAHAIWLLGLSPDPSHKASLVVGLKDADPLVRRRACEALVRVGSEPKVAEIWPLLSDKDRFVRHAARLVLERIDPKEWALKIPKEANDLAAWNAIVALAHIDKVTPYAESVFMRLRGTLVVKTAKEEAYLDHLRTVQLALIHTSTRPAWVKGIAEHCFKLFPHKDGRINRELAILLTQFQREGILDRPIQAKLLAALKASAKDRQQQIHYAYCLRLLKDDWTPEQKSAWTAWYEGTRDWKGGHSFTPFLENIYRDSLVAYTLAERERILTTGEKNPQAALVVAQRQQNEVARELLPALDGLAKRLPQAGAVHRGAELQQAVVDAIARTALKHASAETWPQLLRGVESKNPVLRSDSVAALLKLTAVKPKAEDAAPYRLVLGSATGVASPQERWRVVQLLRQWSGRDFGAENVKGVERELKSWHLWFQQSFPKEPALVKLDDRPSQSKHQFKELLAYLEKAGQSKQGDAVKGRVVFEKANCFKCHKYGKEGEGVGPDLSDVSKRFKRADILEAMLLPSKAISDQYRSVTITTTRGQTMTGLAVVQGDSVTVLLSDATRVTLRKNEIDTQVAALVSVMPEQLLDNLTPAEIADLFAFMESPPR